MSCASSAPNLVQKGDIWKKIDIDNQQVTDGGRVLLNPASATNNDIASCKATSYVVFFVLWCDKSAPKIIKKEH